VKPITVRVSHAKIRSLEQEAHIGNFVLGNLFLVLPESGTITVESDDLADDEYVWTWRP
jgi:hypothetical protein